MQAVPAVPALHGDKGGRMGRSLSLKKTLWIGCGVALITVTVLVVVSVTWLFIAFERGCWPRDRLERLPEDRVGHHGPVWGRVEGGDVIVFGWDEGRPRFGGSLYSIRPDGTGLALLSPSIGDGRELGCYGAPLDDGQLDDGQLDDYRVAFDTSPAISPDGGAVAYATLRQSVYPQGFDIVTVALHSGELRRVTLGREAGGGGADRGTQYEPAWSPDGARIAFLEDGILHTMAVDGSDARSIAPGIRPVAEPPAWSPDGTRLAFRGWLPYDEFWALYVVDSDGSNLTRAAEGVTSATVLHLRRDPSPGKPVWSPDGRRIAFERAVRVNEDPTYAVEGIHVLDVETGTVELLVARAGRVSIYGPFAWTPDGAEVLFRAHEESGPADRPGLYAVTADGEPVIRRFAGLAGNWIIGLAWSPDGARLAVLTEPLSVDSYRSPSAPYADTVLWTVAADGSDARALVRLSVDGELVATGESAR